MQRKICPKSQMTVGGYSVTRIGRNLNVCPSPPPHNPEFLIRKQTQPGSSQDMVPVSPAGGGFTQHSCPRPTLVVSVPTPSWPGASPPLAPWAFVLGSVVHMWRRQHLPRDTSLESSCPYQFL